MSTPGIGEDQKSWKKDSTTAEQMIVTVLVLLVFLCFVVVYNIVFTWGDKYFPLASGIISGTCTLVGVLIAFLVFNFNYKNQTLPLKTEYYKRRFDAVNAAIAQANCLATQCRAVGRDVRYNPDQVCTHVRQIAETVFAHTSLIRVNPLTLAGVQNEYLAVSEAAAELLEYIGGFLGTDLENLDNSQHMRIRDLVATIDKSYVDFAASCGKMLHIPDLAAGVSKMMSAEQGILSSIGHVLDRSDAEAEKHSTK